MDQPEGLRLLATLKAVAHLAPGVRRLLAFQRFGLAAIGETAFGLALCFMCLVVGALSFWSYKDRVKRTRKRLENELKKLDEKSTHNSKDNQKQ